MARVDVKDKVFDPHAPLVKSLPSSLIDRYSFHSYRGAAALLRDKCKEEFDSILRILNSFYLTQTEIRSPGGSKTVFTKRFERIALHNNWFGEVRIHADLLVSLTEGRGERPIPEAEFVRKDFIHGHFIDFWKNRVAFDFEWNSKDQTYDRDLYAFRYFFEAGVIDAGVIVTRDLPNEFFKSLGVALDKDGNETSRPVSAKFGASTTGIGKLMSRIATGRSGGCPVLAIGIKPAAVRKA